MEARNYIIYWSVIYRGDYDKIYNAIASHELPPNDEEVLEVVRKVTSSCITILDEDYPEYLKKKVFHPPFVLYYYGSAFDEMAKIWYNRKKETLTPLESKLKKRASASAKVLLS